MYLSFEFGVSASRDSEIKYFPLNLMPVTVKIASVPFLYANACEMTKLSIFSFNCPANK